MDTGTLKYEQQQQQQQQTQRPAAFGPDRSVITAAGGVTAVGGPAQVEKLPAETTQLFNRDPATNEVLWFAAPPMNMSRDSGPKYSPEYLTFISRRRKLREASSGSNVDGEEEGREARRSKVAVPPTITEIMRDVWMEMRADEYI